jgi:hypothetical protein
MRCTCYSEVSQANTGRFTAPNTPGYSFKTASAPLIVHFVAINTLSSSNGSIVPHVKIAGGHLKFLRLAKKGEMSGSRFSASDFEGR